MKLFHISENGNIDEFVPRKSKQIWGHKKYVWAISESMIHNYLFPRDCPRICVGGEMIKPLTEWMDKRGAKDKRALVFISENWEERFKSCVLYKYEFNPGSFKIIDSIAGYYVSEFTEQPIDVCEIRNCYEILESMRIEVLSKSEQELREIKDSIIKVTNNFSIIKWNNLK